MCGGGYAPNLKFGIEVVARQLYTRTYYGTSRNSNCGAHLYGYSCAFPIHRQRLNFRLVLPWRRRAVTPFRYTSILA
jgi:hypothetical protein